MRIALVTETFLPKWDGIANTLCHLLDHLEARGHTTMLFAPDGVVSSYKNTPVVRFPSVTFPLYPSLRLAPPLFIDMRKHLREFQPDVLHVIGPIALGVEGIRRGVELGIPTLASFHTDVAGFANQWGLGFTSNFIWSHLRELHNQADATLAPSQFTKRQLEGMGFQEVGIWSRGVDTQLFSPARRGEKMRQRLSGGEISKPLLIYVGRLSPEKRIDLLKPALLSNPHCRLAIVGDGPQEHWLRNHFAGTPTILTGALRGKELAEAYASADIFAYTGAHETFGNVVLEAMASGLAVVAPQSGGLLDFTVHGENALLFSPANIHQLASHIGELSTDTRLAGDLARAGLQTAAERTWELTLDGLIAQYQQLIDKHHGPLALPASISAALSASEL